MTVESFALAEQARSRAVAALGVLDSPPEALFDDLAETARAAAGAPVGLLSIIDSDRLWFKACAGAELRHPARHASFCSAAAAPDSPLIVLDARADERFAEAAPVQGPPYIRFYAGAPIFSGGVAVGMLCVIDSAPHSAFSAGEEAQLVRLARMAGDMLDLRARALAPPYAAGGAARRLADEARAFAQAYARLAEQMDAAAGAALARVTGAKGAPAIVLGDVAQDLTGLRALASDANSFCAGVRQSEYCSPDAILDRAVEAARPAAAQAGAAIDYVRSFSDFLMLSEPRALGLVMRQALNTAIANRDAAILRVHANFHDAQDGRRMLRVVIEGVNAKADNLPGNLAGLTHAVQALGGRVTLQDRAMTIMVRAPFAAPAVFLSAQPDIDEQLS